VSRRAFTLGLHAAGIVSAQELGKRTLAKRRRESSFKGSPRTEGDIGAKRRRDGKFKSEVEA
jgi:hypothetical protein